MEVQDISLQQEESIKLPRIANPVNLKYQQMMYLKRRTKNATVSRDISTEQIGSFVADNLNF